MIVSEAQNFSLSVSSGNVNYKTSLMFGVQWDLICKAIEESGEKSQYEIKVDSSGWGNYNNSTFVVTSDNADRIESNHYVHVEKGSIKEKNKNYLYSTGASDDNSALNIYDLPGSFHEFTLEREITNDYAVSRGNYYGRGIETYASVRKSISPSQRNDAYCFRVCLFK